MTTLAKIKGYINGSEWGVYEPAPSLLTYEELITLTQTEALTELNSNVEAYYNKLNSENHIVTGGSFSVYVLGMIDQVLDPRGYDYTTESYPTTKQKGISYHFIKRDSSNSTFVDYNR